MENTDKNYVVRSAVKADWHDAMQLAWRTFLRFEAQDYTTEGIRNFSDFVNDKILYQMFLNGDYTMFVAYDEDRIIGMITLRSYTHISLLFVDEQYHRRGVGRALIERLCVYLKEERYEDHVTVNAAPYGVGFYHRLGFADTEAAVTRDGITYTPMERKLI